MTSEQPDVIESKHLKDVYEAFRDASFYSVKIRSMAVMNAPGNMRNTYIAFREAFDLLYILTFANKHLNKKLVARVGSFLIPADPYQNIDGKIALEGVELFREYVKHLWDQNVLRNV